MTRIQFIYKNHKGLTERRIIELVSLDYVASPNLDYGYGPGWFLHGRDFTERDGVQRAGEPRSFSLDHIQMEGFSYDTKCGTPAFRIKLGPSKSLSLDEMFAESEERFDAVIATVPIPAFMFDTPAKDYKYEPVLDNRLRHPVLLNELETPPMATPVDEPTGGEGNALATTGRLRNAYKDPRYNGQCISGEVYGHTKFPDGVPITTSPVIEMLGGDLFRTKSGSIYFVDTWLNVGPK